MINSTAERRSDFRDLSVLVMEDNQFLRKLVVGVLVGMGITDVRYVPTPEEAVLEFGLRPANVVIVECGADIKLACNLLKLVRRSPQWAHGVTGLVALVPRPDRQKVSLVGKAGAEAIIAEPIAPGILEEHVRVIAQRHYRPQDCRPGEIVFELDPEEDLPVAAERV